MRKASILGVGGLAGTIGGSSFLCRKTAAPALSNTAYAAEPLPPSPSDSAASAAAKQIDFINLPSDYTSPTTTLVLPMLAGYTVSVAVSDHPEIIAAGSTTVTRPANTTPVRITLKAVNNTTGGVGYTNPLLLPVYKPYVAPQADAATIAAAKKAYEQKKYGMMVTYSMNRTRYKSPIYADGVYLDDVDALVNGFDAKQFAKDMHDFGMEYVVFSAWHAHVVAGFPSATNERWRDDRRKQTIETQPYNLKSYTDPDTKDIIAELIKVLEPYDIDLHLYVHASDWHDFSDEDRSIIQSSNFNKYMMELFYELCERYGKGIKGLWNDGFFGNGINQTQYRQTCTQFNPAMILAANGGAGNNPNLKPSVGADYKAWEAVSIASGGRITIGQICSSYAYQNAPGYAPAGWFASAPQDAPLSNRITPQQQIRYLAAQASISKMGGLLLGVGCFPLKPGQTAADLNYNLWPSTIKEDYIQVNEAYITPVKESIINANVGKAYVSPEKAFVNNLLWGVATESPDTSGPDGKAEYVYLHILSPGGSAVSGQTLSLPAPADGSVFGQTAVLMNQDNETGDAFVVPTGAAAQVTVAQTATGGYTLTLSKNAKWSAVDTVIKAKRIAQVR
ncbi:MAG: alpha-L-fucosidase [Planctomycetaceae bacterium]|nr:alpha-L-fucosidase [Planctomycetaceae bacterium]